MTTFRRHWGIDCAVGFTALFLSSVAAQAAINLSFGPSLVFEPSGPNLEAYPALGTTSTSIGAVGTLGFDFSAGPIILGARVHASWSSSYESGIGGLLLTIGARIVTTTHFKVDLFGRFGVGLLLSGLPPVPAPVAGGEVLFAFPVFNWLSLTASTGLTGDIGPWDSGYRFYPIAPYLAVGVRFFDN